MATINHSMPLPLPASGLKTNKGWWLPQVGVPAGYGQSLYPCPLLPGLHSSPYCQPAHCPTSGLPTLEPTQWPHLLDLLGAQLGDVENFLCFDSAESSLGSETTQDVEEGIQALACSLHKYTSS